MHPTVKYYSGLLVIVRVLVVGWSETASRPPPCMGPPAMCLRGANSSRITPHPQPAYYIVCILEKNICVLYAIKKNIC